MDDDDDRALDPDYLYGCGVATCCVCGDPDLGLNDEEEQFSKPKEFINMIKLQIGDVIELPTGLRCRHNQANELTTIEAPVIVVVESAWPIVAGVGGTNHFEDGTLVAARALNTDGTYFPEGALLTFAFGAGDFRPEFILADKPNLVLRKMIRTFIAPPDVTP